MSADSNTSTPNLKDGIAAASLRDGQIIQGRVDDADVVLVCAGKEYFAVGAHCTHYHGPLAEGLVVGQTIRCPWHHACFDLRTGEALRAPALDPIDTWEVHRQGDRLFVRRKREVQPAARASRRGDAIPTSVVIVGGGGAGLAAAEMLRRRRYDGPITLLSADVAAPVDRPNLSKDYLAGEAQDDWIPLRSPEFYTDHHIDLETESPVASIDPGARLVHLVNGSHRPFGALLLATGAEPVPLKVPGAETTVIHYLRSFADSRAIIEAARTAHRAVVIGASFIGLEAAASLRTRNIAVDVVAPDDIPLGRVMGPALGRAIRDLHEAHGVVFHLGETVMRIDGRRVTLSNGRTLEADLVVAGIGVKPRTDLAANAGLAVDRGVIVNEYLETNAPGIFAAGDAVRWLDGPSGERRHVEHWVVAERHGQVAAENMLGHKVPFDSAPFFWSQHYDVTIRYAGYAESWDAIEISGDPKRQDCTVWFKKGGRRLAIATIGRDRENLVAEAEMERLSAGVGLR